MQMTNTGGTLWTVTCTLTMTVLENSSMQEVSRMLYFASVRGSSFV